MVTVASTASFPHIQRFFSCIIPHLFTGADQGVDFQGASCGCFNASGTAQGSVRLAEPLGVSDDDDGSMGELPPLSQWEVC